MLKPSHAPNAIRGWLRRDMVVSQPTRNRPFFGVPVDSFSANHACISRSPTSQTQQPPAVAHRRRQRPNPCLRELCQ
eukprot:747822-Hanusia_phi.AAC.8